MKKIICGVVLVLGVNYISSAQPSETGFSVQNSELKSANRAFKTQLPSIDKVEQFTVTGMGSLLFSASNTADGSYESYNHTQRITLPLLVSSPKPIKVQVLFYGQGEKIQFASTNENDAITVYYPQSFFQEIKQRLEQSLAAKKKIVLTVTQKTTGFREATLQF
jgi:hypothetical protein